MTDLTAPATISAASLFAFNLKRLRTDANMTQAVLSRKLSLHRKTPPAEMAKRERALRVQIANIEDGGGNPGVEWLDDFAAIFKVDRREFFVVPGEL